MSFFSFRRARFALGGLLAPQSLVTSSSVSTSLASLISSIGSRTSASSPAAASSRRMRAASPSVPASMAAKTLAAVDRDLHLDLDQMAGVAVEIGFAHQRPVDAGRGNLQPVGALDRVGHVEHRRQRARDGLAVLDRHAAVRPLRHDLHGAAVGARYLHPHQPVAEALDHRLGDGRDAGRQPRLDDQPRFGLVGRGVAAAFACRASLAAILVTKKSGSRGTHSQNPFGYEGVLTDSGNIAISGPHARVTGISAANPSFRICP